MATIQSRIQLIDSMAEPIMNTSNQYNKMLTIFDNIGNSINNNFNTNIVVNFNQEIIKMNQNLVSTSNKQADVTNEINKSGNAMTNFAQKVSNIDLSTKVLDIVKKAIDISDKMALNETRLSMIVDDGGSVKDLEKKIFESGARSRMSFQETSDMFYKFSLNTGDSFGSNAETLAFIENLNKQYAIAGTLQNDAETVTEKLIDSLNTGVLKGEDFNDILKIAPNIIETMSDYMELSIDQVIKMGNAGELSSDIIKKSMLGATDEISKRLEDVPVTWNTVYVKAVDSLLLAFIPLIEELGKGATFINDNWGILEPIFIGLAYGAGIYAMAMGMSTIATTLASFSMQSLTAVLMACPLLWIALAIGIVIGVIYKWVESVGGIEIAWLIVMNTILSAWNYVKIGLMQGIFAVMNYYELFLLKVMQISFSIADKMGDMRVTVLTILQNMVNGSIDIINSFIGVLNALPNVSINAIAHLEFGATAQLENEKEKAMRQNLLNNIDNVLSARANKRQQEISVERQKAENDSASREIIIYKKQLEAGVYDGVGGNSVGLLGGVQNSIYTDSALSSESVRANALAENSDLSTIANNTGDISDTLSTTKEDMEEMRTLAEREIVNRFTTAQIKVDMGGIVQNVNDKSDLDGIITYLKNGIDEAMEMTANGYNEII